MYANNCEESEWRLWSIQPWFIRLVMGLALVGIVISGLFLGAQVMGSLEFQRRDAELQKAADDRMRELGLPPAGIRNSPAFKNIK